MKVFLPCKIGESFYPMDFVTWKDGKRVYKRSLYPKVLKGIDIYFCSTRCLSIPTIVTNDRFMHYDDAEEGNLGQDYEPRYTVEVRQRSHEKKNREGMTVIVEERFLHIRELNDEDYVPIEAPELPEEDNGQLVFAF